MKIFISLYILLSLSVFAGSRQKMLHKRYRHTKQTLGFLKKLLVDKNTKAPKNLTNDFIKIMREEEQENILKNINFYEQQLEAINEHIKKEDI